MPQLRPSWQEEPCPTWCPGEHEEDDLDPDRKHRSEEICVPVVRVPRSPATPERRQEQVAAEVVVVAYQQQGEARPIVSIGLTEDARVCLDIRGESVDGLAEALRRLQEQLRA